jgi:Uma2 family endonuclease
MQQTAPPVPTRHRFTVDDLERMVRSGILLEDARVELIEGELYDMNPIGWAHQALRELADGAVRDRARRTGDRPNLRGRSGLSAQHPPPARSRPPPPPPRLLPPHRTHPS